MVNLRIGCHCCQFSVNVFLGLGYRREWMGRRNFVLVTEGGGLKDVVLSYCRHVTLVGHEQHWYGSVTEVFLDKGKYYK